MKYINIKEKFSVSGLVLFVVTLCFVLFMFSKSLTPAVESSRQSGGVVDLINKFLAGIDINLEVTDFIVRKTAHFTEFFVYGALLTLTVLSLTSNSNTICIKLPHKNTNCINKANLSVKTIGQNIFKILFFAVLVPLIDETLQYFSPGRSAEVKDVLLDFSGCLTAVVVISIITFLIELHKNKNFREEV